ncbi:MULTISPECIES: hypothetical protein [Streptomyces]|uniref:ATP-binding protein n=1 Tax=Streptomyces albus (strain ATCC 21838 / DSM 41398 / FERM P-419 / JCM 4703 / NBRC 107858) TaxID=1081613 RepID=A0A0B5EV35_STRA4|nr:hypothetical protein [Streptomyces physcomitrii]AJE82556.1 hypothetical protein SLNWT_2180 [Streptomyces albus]AOU76870.1 hypothetical protein SLNHY_2179 [Streptomyces albus]AYN32648.1 hypothetical protein DUI70_2145 [Streptomyces albus]
MSLPLTRRIARVALIVAAGAVPVVAAGSAVAADQPAQGGVSRTDSEGLGDSVDGATKQVAGAAAPAAGQVAEKVAPGTGPLVSSTAKTATDSTLGKGLPLG